VEWDLSSEYLPPVSRLLGWDEATGPYLDHNHRKRIDIGLLTDWTFPIQNLRRSPSHGMAICDRFSNPKFWSDGGKAEVGQSCMTGFIHKDARLKHD